jgi:hypothetical protein
MLCLLALSLCAICSNCVVVKHYHSTHSTNAACSPFSFCSRLGCFAPREGPLSRSCGALAHTSLGRWQVEHVKQAARSLANNIARIESSGDADKLDSDELNKDATGLKAQLEGLAAEAGESKATLKAKALAKEATHRERATAHFIDSDLNAGTFHRPAAEARAQSSPLGVLERAGQGKFLHRFGGKGAVPAWEVAPTQDQFGEELQRTATGKMAPYSGRMLHYYSSSAYTKAAHGTPSWEIAPPAYDVSKEVVPKPGAARQQARAESPASVAAQKWFSEMQAAQLRRGLRAEERREARDDMRAREIEAARVGMKTLPKFARQLRRDEDALKLSEEAVRAEERQRAAHMAGLAAGADSGAISRAGDYLSSLVKSERHLASLKAHHKLRDVAPWWDFGDASQPQQEKTPEAVLQPQVETVPTVAGALMDMGSARKQPAAWWDLGGGASKEKEAEPAPSLALDHGEMERELRAAERAEQGMTPGERKAATPLLQAMRSALAGADVSASSLRRNQAASSAMAARAAHEARTLATLKGGAREETKPLVSRSPRWSASRWRSGWQRRAGARNSRRAPRRCGARPRRRTRTSCSAWASTLGRR